MMELDLSVVYDTLGVSAEDTLSTGEIQDVYNRVFHTCVSPQDTMRAVRKVTGDYERTSCHAEKILDILLEIEKERALEEKLYWDALILNAGILSGKYSDSISRLKMPCPFEEPQDQSQNLEQFQVGCTQDQRAPSSVYAYRLRKEARRVCSRFLSEGLWCVLPSIYYEVKSHRPAEPNELWKTSADLLQHISDKYDIVQQKLCTEMLQDKYGKPSWEALLPQQQKERVEELAAWADYVLDSSDLLHLSELPGAFRLYRSWNRVVLRSCPEQVNPEMLQWTAALSLKQLHSSQHSEKRGLAAVMKSLTVTSLQQLSLYTEVLMMRAEREKHSHGALLAASQSWDCWPDTGGPHYRELASFWLSEQSPWNSDRKSVAQRQGSPQAVLQCMLSCQQFELECLIKLFHSLTPEELQEPVLHSHSSMECPLALRQPCIMKLREVKVALGEESSWGDCALTALTQLMKLHDAEVMAQIQNLPEMNEDYLIELHEKYTANLQAPKLANLLLLLLPDSQQCSSCMGYGNIAESSTSQQLPTGEAPEIPQDTRHNMEGEQQRPEVDSDQRECYSECRNALIQEHIPYLEISHGTDNLKDSYDEGTIVKGEDKPCDVPLDCEKQGSLIALAWGKPAQDANNQVFSDKLVECEETSSQRPEEVSDAPHQIATENADEDEASALNQCSPCSALHCDEPDQEDTSTGKIPSHEAPSEDKEQLAKEIREDRWDPQRLTDNSESAFLDCHQIAGEIQDELAEEAISSDKSLSSEPATLETRTADKTDEKHHVQTTEEAKEPNLDIGRETIHEECRMKAKLFQEQTTEEAASAAEAGAKGIRREATIVHISDMEREETMKSLVDMQKKAENKYQQEKERQKLRVQGRLSIILHKKSEEDLLGLRQQESLKDLTESLKQEDRHRQKTLVKEKLEQLRRERSQVMQSKRDRNIAGFKKLLGPVVLHRPEQENIVNSN